MSVLNASGSGFLYRAGIQRGKAIGPERTLDLRDVMLSGSTTSYTGNVNKPDTAEAALKVAKWNATGPKIFTITGDGSRWESLKRWQH